MKELRTLLDKYWKATSEVEEEELLKDNYGDMESLQDVAFFKYLKEKKNDRLEDPDFDRQFLKKIEDRRRTGRSMMPSWRIAAVIVLLIAAALVFRFNFMKESKPVKQEVLADTYQDPQKAFEETKKALLFISSKLNEGEEYASELGKFSESQEKLKN